MCIFFKTLINCYVGWQDFAILKHMFEKAQRIYPFHITNISPRTNLKFDKSLNCNLDWFIYLCRMCARCQSGDGVVGWRHCAPKRKTKQRRCPGVGIASPPCEVSEPRHACPSPWFFFRIFDKSNPRQSIAAAAAAGILTWTLISLKIV